MTSPAEHHSSPILLTGVGGLVGREVESEFRRINSNVISIMRTGGSNRGNVTFDLTQGLEKLLQAIEDPPSIVVHMAAAVPAPPHRADNAETAQTTRLMDDVVANAAQIWGAHYVYMSTCGLYDPNDPAWKTESSEPVIRSPYFEAKAIGEIAAGTMSAAILRISAPYGPGMQSSFVLSRFFEAARHDQTLNVWGSGAREQDFIAVQDIASAVVAAAETRASGIYNIAQGRPTSMRELALQITGAIGGRMEVGAQDDPSDKHTARYRIDKAKEVFGWLPRRILSEEIRVLCNEELI